MKSGINLITSRHPEALSEEGVLSERAGAACEAAREVADLPAYIQGALAAFIYEIGHEAFLESRVRAAVRRGRHAEAVREMRRWSFDAETRRRSPEMIREREEEIALYVRGIRVLRRRARRV